jgi:segregation and condensation protein A
MTYQCKIDIFEGPLDLLLHLIRDQKMDIHDIPIADITQQYMRYIELMKELNLETIGDYLVMAAELTRIKSRCLLPQQETEEGLEEGQDPRKDLTRRLLEYKRYKEAAFQLRIREYDRQQVFPRGAKITVDEETAASEALVDTSVFDLLSAFQKILRRQAYTKDYEIKVSVFSVADRIEYILDIVNAASSVTFESLFTVLNTRQEIIVTFLALLELMRLKLLRVEQVRHFDTIRIYSAADKATQAEVLKDYHFDAS